MNIENFVLREPIGFLGNHPDLFSPFGMVADVRMFDFVKYGLETWQTSGRPVGETERKIDVQINDF